MVQSPNANSYLRARKPRKDSHLPKNTLPSHEEIALATQMYLEQGGQIQKNETLYDTEQNKVYRANLEPESRLGISSIVDDSWSCWDENHFN